MDARLMATSADDLLADRIASSRALGGNPELTMHGGGNTSVKVMRDGKRVMHVKGSGWDLATLETRGMPGLWLDPLCSVRDGARLGDTDMIRFLRSHLLDPSSPNPSVETLLHAWLPARFVDHGHASAVLVVANQPEVAQRHFVETLFGSHIAYLPYVFPGFDLSVAGSVLADDHPQACGMWLANHGLFTWGETAEESLERFVRAVAICDGWLKNQGAPLCPPTPKGGNPVLDTIASRLENLLKGREVFTDAVHTVTRGLGALPELSGQAGLIDAMSRGTITPDHVIRIKPWPLVVDAWETERELATKIDQFSAAYRAYFDEHATGVLTMLDTLPRIVVVPNEGVVGIGRTTTGAAINADLAEQNMRVVAAAEALGTYAPIVRNEQFLIEYWELEQAKLRK